MKSFQVIVLVVFGILGMVGLFLFATYSGLGGGGAPVGTVTIWGTLPSGAVQSGIETLATTQKEYAGVQYVQISEDTFASDLAEALASGGGPDLLLITQEQIMAQKSKLSMIPFTSISERSFLSTYVPVDELYLTSEGMYGVPLVVDPLVLYYNRSVLSTAGVALPPTTWEAVTGLAEKLTVKQNDQTIVRSAIAFGEYDNVTNARAIISLLFFQAGNNISAYSNTGSLLSTIHGGDASTAGSALNFYTQFANPVKTVYSWNRSQPSSQAAFLAGNLALYVGFASERSYLAEANPNLDFDMAPIPQPSTIAAPVTYARAYALAVPLASKNFGGAFRTAIALSFPDPMESVAEQSGTAPARRSLLSSPPDKYAEIYYPQALIAKGWLSPAPTATDTIFSAMIQSITTGRKDVTAALLSAHQALNAEF